MRDEINNIYFTWLYDLVCGNRFSKGISYRKLLMFLHNTKFRYLLSNDKNRAEDGIGLRYRFARHNNIEYAIIDECLDEPCSVLEMMIALALRCEETIMDDPSRGNRTGQWFWGMIRNLDLGSMTDDRFIKAVVIDIIETFLNREYEADGRGGLFTVPNSDCDLRDIEIWHQLCQYLNTIS